MAAGTFYFTNPEAARQAIAEMQVGAAAAENASREQIAKEQTASQRYATASQIAERDKDRAVAREDIASRSGSSADAVSRERANIQYQTILRSINDFDPPTKKELEALMVASPNLTDDLRNSLRSERETAYKAARANAAMGAQTAKNYQGELNAKGITGKGLDEAEKAKIYERMAKDRNIRFDRTTGTVESAFRMPREDTSPGQANILGATRPGGSPSAQEMQAVGAVPTIGDIKARITGAPALQSPMPDVSAMGDALPLPPPAAVTASDLAPRSLGGRPTMSGLLGLAPSIPMSRAIRASDIAPPASPMDAPMAGGWFNVPPELMPPSGAAAPAENRLLQILEKMPQFSMLPPAGKQMVLDQVTGGLMSLPEPAPPRVSDFQTVRPEFVPQDPGYYVAPQ